MSTPECKFKYCRECLYGSNMLICWSFSACMHARVTSQNCCSKVGLPELLSALVFWIMLPHYLKIQAGDFLWWQKGIHCILVKVKQHCRKKNTLSEKRSPYVLGYYFDAVIWEFPYKEMNVSNFGFYFK